MTTIRHAACLAATLAAGALALAACGGSDTSEATATTAGTTTTPAAATTQAAVTTASVQVKDGQPVGGVKTVTVKKGDRVHISVTVDAPQELHLHGYDIEKEAKPGTPSVFDFVATFDGIFDLESHLTDAKLVKLVVEP
jgi:FtsP/CotA-like multicopper oxidase with cupredoxin domain